MITEKKKWGRIGRAERITNSIPVQMVAWDIAACLPAALALYRIKVQYYI